MAKWIIRRLGEGNDKLTLNYLNMQRQEEFFLGAISSDWPDDSVVEWIFNHAENLTIGDIIELPSGQVFQWNGHLFSEDPWCRAGVVVACA